MVETLDEFLARVDKPSSYAGIGARQTPITVLAHMENLAAYLAAGGWCLRSGGATGADTAFETGARGRNRPDLVDVIRPTGWAIPPAAFRIAEAHHPAWDRCSGFVRRLLARNVCIILGRALAEPAAFVAYWRDESLNRGGTRHALNVARSHGIPTFRVTGRLVHSEDVNIDAGAAIE